MIEQKQIDDLVEKIVANFRPEKVILFGSYAYGSPTEDSDLDLLVVMRFKGKGFVKAADIMNRVSPRVPVDLIVRSPADIRRRLKWKDMFITQVMERGKLLYEARS